MHLNKVQPIFEMGFHLSAIEDGHRVRIRLRGHPLEVEACERNVLSGFRAHSNISKSEASVLIDLETKSVKKLVVEPLATVDLVSVQLQPMMSLTTLSLSLYCVGVQRI